MKHCAATYLPFQMVELHKNGECSKKTLGEWVQPLKEEQVLMVKG